MNERVKDYIHLLWIGGAIVVCVTVSVFMDRTLETANAREHELIKAHTDHCYEQTKEDISVIRSDIKEMKIDIKELLRKK